MADVKKTLPSSVGQSRGIGQILDSCDKELDRLEDAARTACQRLAAGTADEAGCALWERELGLDVRDDLPLEARRTLIRIALEQMDILTPKKLREMMERLLEGEITVEERFSDYKVELAAQVSRFMVPSMRQAEQALRRALPAHLDYSLAARADVETDKQPQRALFSGLKLEIYTEEETT